MSGAEAAAVLAIEPALFRKRLQLAREAVLAFTRSHCCLISDEAACQCVRRVASAALAAFDEAQPLQFARRICGRSWPTGLTITFRTDIGS